MKHLIIGAGIVGKATGILLQSHNEDVYFNDVKEEVLLDIQKNGYQILRRVKEIDSFDIVWICTAEWNTPSVLKNLPYQATETIVVIRSTMPPGETKKLSKETGRLLIAHVPEFLKEATYIEDAFHPDRIVIGSNQLKVLQILNGLFSRIHPNVPILTVTPTTSELIKLASNAWLATQISYWNEIHKISKQYNVDPQEVANGCTLDHRISTYGTKMIGQPFSGFCLPKDLITLQNSFKDKKMTSEFLKHVAKANEK